MAGRLAAIVGAANVLTDADLRATYETDWTRRFTGSARLVVRPASTGEAAAVLRECTAAGAAVVPQGGNTGLVGGGVPRGGEVVLSTRRMQELGPVDTVAREVIVGAGVTLAQLNEHVRPHGLRLGVDLASRDSATLGGMVATNAGGINVLRHGMMRAQVAGVEAVLADGRVVSRLTGLKRDNTGYDLAGLLAGSEGTLAVMTRLRLRLVPSFPKVAVALMGMPDVAAAVDIAAMVRASLPSLNAAETFFAPGLELVCRHAGLAAPFAREYPVYLLLEAADINDPAPALAEVLAHVDAPDTAFATEPRDRARLWAYRERHTEAISKEGVPHKLDVALPLASLPEFVERVGRAVTEADPGARAILFGHIADGNLHVNVLGPEPDDERVDEAVLRLVAGMGGSISAEHGIGVAKTRWLHLTRSAADIAAMKAVKAALDPKGTLNQGVIFGD
ncbi:MAG: FAD-binding oxidoreductase [Chloroflexi bacterium]|nr:FAD-binding oxidoreductase [Chloroflexota bacterium]